MTFYNTTNENGDKLKEYQEKAMTQEEKIYKFFLKFRRAFSPDEIQRRCLPEAPLTSVRRAMTNLTYADKLVRTNNKAKGRYGRNCHTWSLVGEPVKISRRTKYANK